MSYQRIAELVHDLVKNPKSLTQREHGLLSTKLKTNEFTSIQRVFSKPEVSSDVLTFDTIALDFW